MDISTFQRWRAAERGEVLIFWALVVQAQFHQLATIPPWNPTRTDQAKYGRPSAAAVKSESI